MSEILKNDDAVEMPAETPLTGADESITDVPEGEVTESMIDQEVSATGAAEDQQPELDDDAEEAVSGEAPEGTEPDVKEDQAEGEVREEASDPVANETQEQESFWGGFFGSPNIPTVK